MMVWRNIIFHILFTSVSMHEFSENVFQNIPDLHDLCPYSSFCGRNASLEMKDVTKYRTCCHSCSCKSDCGLHDNCCFSALGVNTRPLDEVTCRHSFVSDPYKSRNFVKSITYYKMVNKCFCSKTTMTSGMTCEQVNRDLPFAPVFSPSSDKIYSNERYAECNNEFETIPWLKTIVCEPGVVPSIPNDDNDCIFYYMPPNDIDLDKALCYPDVVRTCNTTGGMITRKPFWDFCKKFNATFILQTSRFIKAYANVYCLMCNTLIWADSVRNMQCETNNFIKEKAFHISALAILLNTKELNETTYLKQDHHERQFCPKYTKQFSSLKNECRQFQCKKGQLLINNRCGYYSSEWIGGPFAAMLRLTPTTKDILIPFSFFENMNESKRNDRQARWIRRRQMVFWNFYVLFHVSRDQSSVEYIVIKATYPSTFVSPLVLNKFVKEALGRLWYIDVKNSTFTFRVNLNDYIMYKKLLQNSLLTIGVNPSTDVALFPKLDNGNVNAKDYEHVLLPVVSKLNEDELNEGFFVTELFFCDQVDLLPEEFFFMPCYNAIFFKVKNKLLKKFSLVHKGEITLKNVDGKTVSKKQERKTVRICASEFEASLAAIETEISSEFLVMLSITASITILIRHDQ